MKPWMAITSAFSGGAFAITYLGLHSFTCAALSAVLFAAATAPFFFVVVRK